MSTQQHTVQVYTRTSFQYTQHHCIITPSERSQTQEHTVSNSIYRMFMSRQTNPFNSSEAEKNEVSSMIAPDSYIEKVSRMQRRKREPVYSLELSGGAESGHSKGTGVRLLKFCRTESCTELLRSAEGPSETFN